MNKIITPVEFKYVKFPDLRFIGIDAWRTKEAWGDMWKRRDEFLPKLDQMQDGISKDMPYVTAFCHHDDGEINDNNEPDRVNRYLIGRFFVADTPVPKGYDFFDFKSQTAGYAVFDNMTDICDGFWQRYIITRDTILNDGITIPYPVGYWHAEVYFDKTPADPQFDCGVLFACNKQDKLTWEETPSC